MPVHPRAGGGATSRIPRGKGKPGPSPRRRGSHRPVRSGLTSLGSIPAQAGEPSGHLWPMLEPLVHPRAGGGAAGAVIPVPGVPGPSPRRRGSPELHIALRVRKGSIPAQAGEPHSSDHRATLRGVHPRAGGGAAAVRPKDRSIHGPSPRRRGSQSFIVGCRCPQGSIPAQAGEPLLSRCCRACLRVHPRAGGGASSTSAPRDTGGGPSPRRRGSPYCRGVAGRVYGSIPAQAGEPLNGRTANRTRRVHPRAGGGASPN